jgi:hypothetical protein
MLCLFDYTFWCNLMHGYYERMAKPLEPGCDTLCCVVLCCVVLCCAMLCCVVLCCRLPLEAESAALGAALQAAAVHSKVPVGQYVQQNQPPVSEKVCALSQKAHYKVCTLFPSQGSNASG